MNKKKKILINILVVCLYFLWPYFLNSFFKLFNLSELQSIYISFSVNFFFLFIILYIYRDVLRKQYNNIIKNYKNNFIKSIKIFSVGFIIYLLFNALFVIIDIPMIGSLSSKIDIFKKIPVMFILNTLFYYPIIEELIFKLSFKEILKNKWTFIIITGLFNAFFQIVFSLSGVTDLLYVIPYVFFFGALSYVYYETDNIFYAIVLRMCYNVIPCVIYMIDLFVR